MSGRVMVDSNVLIDVFTEDKKWFAWSSRQLAECADNKILCINPIIFSEISIGFAKIEELASLLPRDYFQYLHLPYEAAFLAGKCYLRYRRAGGVRRSPLPDFYIGAHAAVEKMVLLTRDASRYRTYFPGLHLISP